MNFFRRPLTHQLINNKNGLFNIVHCNYAMKNIQNSTKITQPIQPLHAIQKYANYSSQTFDEHAVNQRNYSNGTGKIAHWKYQILKKLGFTDDPKQVASGRSIFLYEVATHQINFGDFLTTFKKDNSFNTWFLIMEIHIWMTMVRAMGEAEFNETIRNMIVETMWSDVTYRAKKFSPNNSKLIMKQIEEMSGQFQYAILSYDEGLMTDDKRLAGAVWERFFERNCDDYELIELMVKYIRMNISMLDKLSHDDFIIKRTLKWITLSECKKQ